MKNLKTTAFRLYQTDNSKYKSSFFDLIHGDHETKQTKGLAYLFNLSPEFLKEFLSLNKINELIKYRLTQTEYGEFLRSDFLTIDAEMMSTGEEKVRRDITLTFFYKSKKSLVLIIEAKSIKSAIVTKLEEQMEKYVNTNYFPQDVHVPTLAVAITKYKQTFTTDEFISLTWVEIIQVLQQTLHQSIDTTISVILTDYYRFITGVDKGMKYYEREILSVPAGKTFEEIIEYHIHACPDTPSYNYKDSLFIAFRQKGGGVMDKLYKVEDTLVLPPHNLSVLEDVSKGNLPYKKRLLEYMEKRKKGHGFKNNDTYRFYILAESEHILLPHCPHPEKNNAGGWYYTLSEMLSGREVVNTDSK